MVATQQCDLCVREEIIQSFDHAMIRAGELTADATRLTRSSRVLCLDAQRLRAARRGDRSPEPVPTTGSAIGFRLRGFVANEAVAAVWTAEGLVRASQQLLLRADLIERIGDTFNLVDGSVMSAGLNGGATRALLTLMRACDRVESISVTVSGPNEAVPIG